MFRKSITLIFALGLLAGLAFGLPGTALADCQDTGDVPGANGGDIVTCDNDPGADPDGYTASANNDQITVEAGATVGDGTGFDDINGEAGDDTITNNGTSSYLYGDDGEDTITNNGTSKQIYGGEGDDTIINNGTTESDIYGEGGEDTITNTNTNEGQLSGGNDNDTILNSGTSDFIDGGPGDDEITNSNSVTKYVRGGGDNDTITHGGTANLIEGDFGVNGDAALCGFLTCGDDQIENSGTVTTNIEAGPGDDTVTLSGDDVSVGGTIDGGDDNDTLNFNMSTTDQNEFDTANTAINTAIGKGHAESRFAWNGGNITWVNFETLINNLTFIQAVQLTIPADPTPAADGAGGDDGSGGGEDGGSASSSTVYSDVNVSVSQDSSNGTLYFFGENGGSNHLLAALSSADYAGAAAGEVLVTTNDADLGVVLYVASLGNGQISVQYYSTVDGSLLSNTVITL